MGGLKLLEFWSTRAREARAAKREEVKDTSGAEKALREELREENEQLRDRLDSLDKAHLDSLDKIRAQVNGLMASVQQVQHENAALRKMNEELLARVERLRVENAELVAQNARLVEQNRDLIGANGRLAGQVAHLMSDIETLEGELGTWRKRAGLPPRRPR